MKAYRGIDVVTKKYVYGNLSTFWSFPVIEVEQGDVMIKPGSLEHYNSETKTWEATTDGRAEQQRLFA